MQPILDGRPFPGLWAPTAFCWPWLLVQLESCQLGPKASPGGAPSFSDLHRIRGGSRQPSVHLRSRNAYQSGFPGGGMRARLTPAVTLSDLVPLHLAGSDVGLDLRILNTVCASGVHWERRPPGVRNSG